MNTQYLIQSIFYSSSLFQTTFNPNLVPASVFDHDLEQQYYLDERVNFVYEKFALFLFPKDGVLC